MTLHNSYRQFKSDLALPPGELGSVDRNNWQMLSEKSSQRAERYYRPESTSRNQYFSALPATQAFLYAVCRRAVQRTRELFPEARDLKIHFTVPAYDGDEQTGADGQDAAGRYRANLREILREVQSDSVFEGVEFRILAKDRTKAWLYEPYGVYYYYSAFENRIPLREGGATYLIFDMGGSTTDVAAVQVTKTGNEFRKYPSCASFQFGGTHFDRFVLKSLLKHKQVSPEAEAELLRRVEEAKVAVCDGQESVQLRLQGYSVALSRDDLAHYVAEFWDTPQAGRTPREWLIDFITGVRRRAESEQGYHAFERFSSVFLAGGSVSLPGLEDLLRRELENLGLLSNGIAAFVRPRGGVKPSCVTALGLAAEVAQADRLDRASTVYARFIDEAGGVLWFPLTIGTADGQPEETVVFSRRIPELVPSKSTKRVKLDGRGKNGIYAPVPRDPLPRSLAVQFRNDLTAEYSTPVDLQVQVPGQVVNEPTWITLSSEVSLGRDSRSVQIKPALFWNTRSDPGNRLNLKGQGRFAVPLQPGYVQGDAHICIDFGMSNTVVAVFAPGRAIPASADLQIFEIGGVASAETRKLTEDREQSVRAGEPDPDAAEASAETPEVLSAVELTPGNLDDTAELLVRLRSLEKRLRRREEALGLAAGGGDTSPVVQPEVWTTLLEEKVKRPLEGLADAIGAALQQGPRLGPSVTSTPTAIHPRVAVETEFLASQNSFGLARSEDDLTAVFRDDVTAVPAQLVERFKLFLSRKYPLLRYSDSTLRAVISECRNPEARLVVLAGPPGTGKSTLVRVLAEFFNQTLPEEELDRIYLLQPVSPTWFSPVSLLGGFSELEGRFRGTPFLTQLYRAAVHREMHGDDARLFFICLDEFNLAHPEQYLADVLSAMEAATKRIAVCRGEDVPHFPGGIVAELSPNLKIFATVNVDASTHLLSTKVLDRSHLIRLLPSLEDLRAVSVRIAASRKVQWFEPILDGILEELYHLSAEARTPLGYRTLAKAYAYAEHATEGDAIDPGAASALVEDVLCHFVLSRLPSAYVVNSAAYLKRLRESAERLESLGYARAGELARKIHDGFPGQVA